MRLNEGARCESRRMRRAHALSRVELGFLRQIKCHKCYLKYYIWYTHHNCVCLIWTQIGGRTYIIHVFFLYL